MAKIEGIAVPQGSLLAEFGAPDAYRDCFAREVPGAVSLEEFVERFYCSAAFRPERIALGLIGRGADNSDAQAVARGKADNFAAWTVIERRANEILLQDFQEATASWFTVQPSEKSNTQSTKLLFGSWVGQPDRGIVKALMPFHRWYSRFLLSGVT